MWCKTNLEIIGLVSKDLKLCLEGALPHGARLFVSNLMYNK